MEEGKFIELANKRSTILSSKYRAIINAYYAKVHIEYCKKLKRKSGKDF